MTRKGFSLLPNLKGAVETLCQLRGVGPATASGVCVCGGGGRVVSNCYCIPIFSIFLRFMHLHKKQSRHDFHVDCRNSFVPSPNYSGPNNHRTLPSSPLAALLCAAAPDNAPFMADEAVMAVPGLGKLDYTLKHYLSYTEAVGAKAKELNTIC